MRRVLFLSFSGYSEHNGISKKKLAQIKGLQECGCDVTNCYYNVDPVSGHRLWMTDDRILIDLGKGIKAKIRKRTNYKPIQKLVDEKRINLVYIRSEHNASPFLISFVRKLRKWDVQVVMEIPTYPYDQEYDTFKGKCSLLCDKLFRKTLARELNAIVTFSNEGEIFGQQTIRISNGIDFNSIRLKKDRKYAPGEVHLIAVAEIHYWHGYDRIVAGLAEYYKSGKGDERLVYLHLVGDCCGKREKSEILRLIVDGQLEEFVIRHGQLFGESLDEVFDLADIGVGSLARHRSGITHIKTLKNREYAVRGIPFVYSETDDDFEDMPYVFKVSADESPIDIRQLLDFYNSLTISATEIRASVQHLAWAVQMQKVLKSIFV